MPFSCLSGYLWNCSAHISSRPLPPRPVPSSVPPLITHHSSYTTPHTPLITSGRVAGTVPRAFRRTSRTPGRRWAAVAFLVAGAGHGAFRRSCGTRGRSTQLNSTHLSLSLSLFLSGVVATPTHSLSLSHSLNHSLNHSLLIRSHRCLFHSLLSSSIFRSSFILSLYFSLLILTSLTCGVIRSFCFWVIQPVLVRGALYMGPPNGTWTPQACI